MALKDRFLSAVSNKSSGHRHNNNSSSASSSSSEASTSSASSSTKNSTSSLTITSVSSTTSRIGALFRPSRRSRTPTSASEQWVDPPLKYSDPPQQEYVDMLAAWDWDGATRWRRGSWESCVSPGTSRRGSWI